MFCKKCGKEIDDNAKFCPYCGEDLKGTEIIYDSNKSNSFKGKSRGLALIFACLGFFCISGIHRFYVGKIGTGILWLLTGGLFGIGTLIDVIMIATGSFTDIDGNVLTNWNIE